MATVMDAGVKLFGARTSQVVAPSRALRTAPPSCRRGVSVSATATPSSSGREGKPITPQVLNAHQQPEPVSKPSKSKSPTIKSSNLRRTGTGVKTATRKYELPPPSVAVRNLVEQASHAHLCTLMCNMQHRRAGYPYATLVDFCADGAGFPLFCLSPLSIHSRNLIEDSRCSLELQLPGWAGLANARVTIFGDVFLLPDEMQQAARDLFELKALQNGNDNSGWMSANHQFFRMHRIMDIDFVGGFGTVQWIDVQEYSETLPDSIVMDKPYQTLTALNDSFSGSLCTLLTPGHEADDAAFVSVDASGADVRVRFGPEFQMERVSFDSKVANLEQAVAATRRALGLAPDE